MVTLRDRIDAFFRVGEYHTLMRGMVALNDKLIAQNADMLALYRPMAEELAELREAYGYLHEEAGRMQLQEAADARMIHLLRKTCLAHEIEIEITNPNTPRKDKG